MSTPEASATSRPLWRRIVGGFWFQLLVAFVVIGCVLNFVAKPYWVPSGSMEETLLVGDRVLVNRMAYLADEPSTGDVIVFDADESWGGYTAREESPLRAFARWVGEVSGFGPSGPHTLIKRTIAGPGQTVECCTEEGEVIVDGAPLDEPYIFEDYAFEAGVLDCDSEPRSARCFAAVTVPEDSFLMLGDHRSRSSDASTACRYEGADESCWRWAHRDHIVGKAAVILWPFSRWAGL